METECGTVIEYLKVRSSLLLMNSVWNDPVIKEVIRKHGWK